MKNKSSRHKDANTFKFQPFSERISNIDVDIFHKVSHEYEAETEESESYFYQAIQKWDVLNLTEGYGRFKRDLKAENYITLPQVLLAKDCIIEVLLKHLKVRDPLYLQAVLEVVVAVAKDLQKEFYPHYQQFLEVIIDLLNTKDTDQLEWTFTSLAYLFKILWRPMIKNINEVCHSLVPLLSDTKPEYVNAFAAESFAFVARKVKDKSAFLALLLKSVHKNKDGVSGCAKLLFEVVRGVDGQFHSCAEQFLPFYIDFLCNQPQLQDTFFEVFEYLVANIAAHIHPQKTKPFWDVLFKALSDFVDKTTNLELLLKLVGHMVEHKHGKLVHDSAPLVLHLSKLLSVSDLPKTTTLIIIQIAISVLLSPVIRLPQEQASQLIYKVLSLNQKDYLLFFIEHISECSLFETLILPAFLRRCGGYDFDKECIYTLTRLVIKKRPLCPSGTALAQWTKYPIDLKEFRPVFLDKLSTYLDLKSFDELQDKAMHFCALVCLPHLILKPEQTELTIKQLVANLQLLLKEIQDKHDQESMFWLNLDIECLIHLNATQPLEEQFVGVFETLLNYIRGVEGLSGLKTLSLLFAALPNCQKVVNMEVLNRLNEVCEGNFSDPHHQVRLQTAFIYSQFEQLPEFQLKHSTNPDIPNEQFKVFSLIYEVENIEPSVDTYRDQLRRLEKLSFDKPQMIMCNQIANFQLIPLRYLCGVLYINFKLLWEPVCKIIESHAHGLEISTFWTVFVGELKKSVSHIKAPPQLHLEALESDLEALSGAVEDLQTIDDKPDFINYRQLLWRALVGFADVAEAKTRDVAQLMLSFVEDEYTNSNAELATVANIKTFSQESVVEAEPGNEEVEEEEEKEDKVEEGKQGKVGRKVMIKTFLNKLAVFAQFKSPKSMYREPELYRLYFGLLKHKNASVQKAALDCLMTYKFKYLQPYKDHLYGLVDDKNFKNALSNFRIDKESTQVLGEHRAELIPVVLQVVFSKMSGKTGLRTGGKASGQNRRNLVLRFLAGCEEEEMLAFARKGFAIYEKYLQPDELDMVKTVSQVDLERCLAPKKLLSTINLLNVILDQFGGLMGEKLLTYLLKVLLVVGGVIEGVFRQGDKVHSGYLAVLRTVRTSSIKTLERFFEQFDSYLWSCAQIEAVFHVFVWPYLGKLTMEGIHSPTNLLKLFKQWGSKPRYFKLLVKIAPNGQTILPQIFALLLGDKTHITVVKTIYEMVECLLKYEPSQEDNQLEIPVEGIDENVELRPGLNYGSCILLPHVPKVLTKIKQKLQTKNKSLNRTELFILCRISELVWESDISGTVLQLLVPVVLKKAPTADEEVMQQLLTTILNLLKNVDNPQNHLRTFSPLLASVSHQSCRKLLISILHLIAKQSDLLKTVTLVIEELNSFDTKWLDKPDYERRHQGFKNIQELTSLDVSCGALLLFNLFYMMKSEKDLALRDNSLHTLRNLCITLLQKTHLNQQDLDYLINGCIFNLIKTGLRCQNNQEYRNDCITLLGYLAKECPESHFALRDLNKFTSQDQEVDCFENLTHLQMHRHARAMIRFSKILREETVALNPKTVTQFLLPLASFYLCTDKFSGKNSVVDAAIEMIGIICQIVPWHQYEGILKYALSKLRYKPEFQKQLVRLVVVILDGFHFDLSKGHVNDSDLTDTVQEIEVIEDDFDAEDLEDQEAVRIVDKTAVLCKSTATRVIKTIQTVLLPQLHKTLAEFTSYDTSHKVNRKRTGFEREEEDLARVPISLAVVKLLQRLPKAVLDFNLPRVFLKLCTFLKSRLESVRRVARETLQKIMLALGPKYLSMLLGQITPLMNRGYQVHVLVFTVHGVLSCLKGSYQPKDIDEVLLTVLNLCTADLFGVLSEEKEVVKITVKVTEARSTKSYDTLHILAQHITEQCLMDLILPIKKFLETSHSFKTVQKVQDALKHIALGLVDNEFVQPESLLKFAYGTSAEKIPTLLPAKKKKLTEEEKKRQQIQKEDCFIIAKVPGNRSTYRELNVRTSSQTNAHLLVEFGLRLCFVLLKRDKIKDEHYRPFLDPFVSVFKKCLKSKHVKLCSLTLQCLQWVMKYATPAMQQHIKVMAKDMFAILHKYAAAGLSKGDNFDLVVAAFKAVAVLVRDVQYYTLDTNQLKILLLYVEQDMHDHDRQATAFSLLKSIVTRKLIVPEIHDVMTKVAELSVTSELSHVRAQARSVFHQFLMEYPLGNTLETHLGFYISQMSYEMQYGRESAIEMIHSLINSFPLPVLKDHSGTLLITLGARLVNDEVPECRKMVAECLASMLKKLPKLDRDGLFEIITLWLKDKEIGHRRLAAQLCGIFVQIEKEEFEDRLPVLTPLILKQFGLTNNSPGKFVKLPKPSNTTEDLQRLKDHHHFQVLQLILKICAHCPAFLKTNPALEKLAYHSQTLLAYPHEWVRLASAQFLGFVLSSMDVDNLATLLLLQKSTPGYLTVDPENCLKSLTLDLCDQLQPGVKSDLAEQVIKNLVFVARALRKVPTSETKRINLLWLGKRMRKIVNSEVIDNNANVSLRTEVFKWIAGVVTALDAEAFRPVIPQLLAPLVREMITTEEKNAPLRQLAKEVANRLKKKIGMDEYTETLQKLQQNLNSRRAERKRVRLQLAVTNPEVYAQKKIKLHEKKKIAKKRKLEEVRGKKTFKRKRVVDLEDNCDIV